MWTIYKEITVAKSGKEGNLLSGEIVQRANNFNNFFYDNIQQSLKNFPKTPFKLEKIIYNERSMFLKPTTHSEIFTMTTKLKNKFSYGVGEIPMSIVKLAIKSTCNILSYIINNTFKFGTFPDLTKTSSHNFRPISLLPNSSKVFKIIIYNKMLNFYKECSILSESPHAHIKGKSTLTAIFEFLKYAVMLFERGKLAKGMLLNISKAYDTVCHGYLLKKLDLYAVRKKTKGNDPKQLHKCKFGYLPIQYLVTIR